MSDGFVRSYENEKKSLFVQRVRSYCRTVPYFRTVKKYGTAPVNTTLSTRTVHAKKTYRFRSVSRFAPCSVPYLYFTEDGTEKSVRYRLDSRTELCTAEFGTATGS